jgi:hypothetical protein
MRDRSLMLLLAELPGVIIVNIERIEFGALARVRLMTNQNCITSACRYCRFYRPEGLHGGACQQLGVSVRSDWKACQLGLPAFANAWENAEELATANRQAQLQAIANHETIVTTTLELTRIPLGINN